jgi:hypothetical protein
MAKAAFIVGINAYDPPNALPSCVNDADNIASLLSATYGFQSIANLRDREASKSAILDGLNTLLSGAASGDDLVFYFSGHGYSFQQGTSWIEALVPQDADFLTSDDLSAVTQGAPPNSLTIVLDSCFSGGMQKAFAKLGGVKPARVKYWTPPTTTDKAFDPGLPAILTLKAFGTSPAPFDIASLVPATSTASKDFSIVSPPSDNRHFILLSACQANETAAASTDHTEGQSAFTFSLLQQIKSNGSQIGVAGLLDETGSELRQLNGIGG